MNSSFNTDRKPKTTNYGPVSFTFASGKTMEQLTSVQLREHSQNDWILKVQHVGSPKWMFLFVQFFYFLDRGLDGAETEVSNKKEDPLVSATYADFNKIFDKALVGH